MSKWVFFEKYKEKLGVSDWICHKHEWINAKTKRERTELQLSDKSKKKGSPCCVCGLHSISGYKERWKYPVWKKKSRRLKGEAY